MEMEITAAKRFLANAQRLDGSWPYRPASGQGSPEPTCFCLLALANADRISEDPMVSRTGAWLARQVNGEGAVTLEGDDQPHWSTAHLVLTLTHLQLDTNLRDRCVAWLLSWKGNPAAPFEGIPLNGQLIGWPWISDTFSWVEPTSLTLLALKQAGIRSHGRIREAEQLLCDRACVGGGWNVGNPVVLGRPLEAFLPTTALALLALQDVDAAAALVEQGLTLLEDDANQAYSTLSLALTILCMDAYGRPTGSFVHLLRQRQQPDGSWRQMVHLTALSILALRSVTEGVNVFKL
ncbi:MAG: prenyltransferase/squalene oxidase repeat-containing protein [Anaerolineae bacterium]